MAAKYERVEGKVRDLVQSGEALHPLAVVAVAGGMGGDGEPGWQHVRAVGRSRSRARGRRDADGRAVPRQRPLISVRRWLSSGAAC